MKLPKDFGRIKMEEEMLRQDAKRRMKAWREENKITGAYYEEKYTWKDYLYIIPPIALLVYVIIRSII